MPPVAVPRSLRLPPTLIAGTGFIHMLFIIKKYRFPIRRFVLANIDASLLDFFFPILPLIRKI